MNTLRITTGVGLTLAGAVLAGASAMSSASAASSPGSVSANVSVNSKITLSNITPSFTLTGDPSTTATQAAAVTMSVKTNSRTGYNVTVQAGSAAMVGAVVGNTDTIPVTALSTREGTAPYLPLSATLPLPVHSQTTRSAGGGDALSEDFQVAIPFVSPDTYSATLNYTANTQ